MSNRAGTDIFGMFRRSYIVAGMARYRVTLILKENVP